MKKFLSALLLTLSLSYCSQVNDALYPHPTKKQEMIKDIGTAYTIALLANPILDFSVTCTFPPANNFDNAIYGTAGYWPVYNFVTTQYQNIIIGDSTMDISRNVAGWLDSTITYAYPVSGNRFCDMIHQWVPQSRQKNVQVVIIATAGGNDLLQNENLTEIINNGKILINKARAQWPNAKIVMIAIHPTQMANANVNKPTTNNALKAYLNGMSNTCFYDPWPLFTGVTNDTMAAQSSDMIDSIHYNAAMAMKIKTALNTNCGITF